MAETDTALKDSIEKDEAALDARAEYDARKQARFEAWEAEETARQDEANRAASGFSQEDLDSAVKAALERAGVQSDPGRDLTPEELAPGRQLSPQEQGHYVRTGEVPAEGKFHDVHLTSHPPL
jgi:hypothetical protein